MSSDEAYTQALAMIAKLKSELLTADEVTAQALATIGEFDKKFDDRLKHISEYSEYFAKAKAEVESDRDAFRSERAAIVDKCLSARELQLKPCRLTSLPPEIRNMIYRFALFDPHGGYLKCYYDVYVNCESKLYIPKSIPLQLFRVCRQIKDEASSLFYGENVFAIADQQRSVRNAGLGQLRNTRSVIDVSRIRKMHITNVESRWLSDQSRTSPRVFREASKHHIAAFAKAFHEGCHQLQYLLIDCSLGFVGLSTRQVKNLFHPIYLLVAKGVLSRLNQVHIVNFDGWEYPCLRYLEERMVDNSVVPSANIHIAWSKFQNCYGGGPIETEAEEAGNALAAFLKIKPCYPSIDRPDA